MTLAYTGRYGACAACGRPTTFQDIITGEHRHVGPLCAARPAIPAGPRPGKPATLPAPLVPLAAATRARIHAIAEACGGDLDKILKKAIPVVMDLFEEVRAAGRYPVVHHPPYPEILHKPTAKGAHQIWLARPNWTNPEPPRGPVDRLDVPGSYLQGYSCWLPVQALRHDTTGRYDARQSGVYRITPPAWTIPDLPNPLGNRDEAGPVWVSDPTLRNLLRCHVKYQLCEAPVIHESWTAPATEDMLTNLKRILAFLRSTAYAEGDELLKEMVKGMYSKFYATIGESNDNHRMRRPEWNCIVQAQGHWMLWERAYKARQAGLQVVKVGGTDELHLVGDWRMCWTEGNELTQMKIKDS